MKLRDSARGDIPKAGRLLLLSRGVAYSVEAHAGAMLEAEFQDEVRSFIRGMGGK